MLYQAGALKSVALALLSGPPTASFPMTTEASATIQGQWDHSWADYIMEQITTMTLVL